MMVPVIAGVALTLSLPSGPQSQGERPRIFEDYMLELKRGEETLFVRFGPPGGSFWDNWAQLDDPNKPATRIRYAPEPQGVRFRILVFQGPVDRFATERQLDLVPQTLVAEFVLEPGDEPVKVSELFLFGLPNLEMRLVPARTDAISPFDYENQTSLQVIEVEEFQDRFKLRLVNNSQKAVIAVCLTDGASYAMPGRRLIEPGSEWEKDIHKGALSRPDLETRSKKRLIQVNCAVYEDYTFEGDSRRAAQFAIGRRGSLLGLRKILPVFRRLIENPPGDAAQTLTAIFDQIPAVDTRPSETEQALTFEALGRSFGISAEFAEQLLHSAARDSARFLLDEINWNARRKLESDRPEAVWTYLKRSLERWSARLDALEEDFRRVGW